MTSPVIIKSKTNKGWFESCTYTMSFLLPSDHQLNPPKPTDSEVDLLVLPSLECCVYLTMFSHPNRTERLSLLQVTITELPTMNVYVKSYGGWMMSYRARDKESELMESLESVGATYNREFSYAVGYDR